MKMELWTLHQLRVWSKVVFSSNKTLIRAQQIGYICFRNYKKPGKICICMNELCPECTVKPPGGKRCALPSPL